MLKFNIKGGKTPNLSAASLCESCENSHIIKGAKMVTICTSIGYYPNVNPVIDFKVTECSEHLEKGRMSLHDMQRVAWEVKARKRGPVGYKSGGPIETVIVPPRDRKSDEEDLLEKIFPKEETNL